MSETILRALAGTGPAVATRADAAVTFHKRAAEHLTTADTPGLLPGWLAPVGEALLRAAAPILAAVTVVRWLADGVPLVADPTPWAAATGQPAEKQDVHSAHRTINAVTVERETVASVVNVAMQHRLAGQANGDLLLQALASSAEAGLDRYLCGRLVANGTAAADLGAALDALEQGGWQPGVVAGPRKALLGLDLDRLDRLGLEIVGDGNLASVIVLDRAAATVILGERFAERRLEPMAVGETAVVGRHVAVGVAATGVAVLP